MLIRTRCNKLVCVEAPNGAVAIIDATIPVETLRALKARIERRIRRRERRREMKAAA